MSLGLALIAGTPLAAWLTQYIGWVYGGLTLVSILSLVLGWRWMARKELTPNPQGNDNVLEEIAHRSNVRLALSTSPAVAPIIVPRCFDSALLAGTPAALWVTHNAGWVYGGLTLVSLISLIFGLYFLGDKTNVGNKQESRE